MLTTEIFLFETYNSPIATKAIPSIIQPAHVTPFSAETGVIVLSNLYINNGKFYFEKYQTRFDLLPLFYA